MHRVRRGPGATGVPRRSERSACWAARPRRFLGRVCPLAFDSQISIYPSISVDGIYTCCERLVKVGELTEPLTDVTSRSGGRWPDDRPRPGSRRYV